MAQMGQMPLQEKHEVQGWYYQQPTLIQYNRQQLRERSDLCPTPHDRR
jgi:hypothetical protein